MSETPIQRALRWASDLGMNQSALARKLNVSPQDVTNWKKRGMPPEHYAAVAKAVNKTVDELIEPDELKQVDSVQIKLQRVMSRHDSISPRSQKTLETLLHAAERNALTDEHWALLDELSRRFIQDRKQPRP